MGKRRGQNTDGSKQTSKNPSYTYMKEIGEHIEALMIARELAKMDRRKSLAEKLDEINYGKDTYYSRLDKLVKEKGVFIYHLIDDYISCQAEPGGRLKSYTPGQLQDIFRRLDSLKEWYDNLGRDYRPPIRLGLSPILARTIVGPILRNYKDKLKNKHDGIPLPELELAIGMSGYLRRLFDEKQLDLYVSQYDGTPQSEVSLDLPFCLICNAKHSAAMYVKNNPGCESVPFTEIAPPPDRLPNGQSKTTLVLVGPHPNRSPQFHFPQARFYELAGNNNLRILEVDTFDLAHGLVMCDNSYITLSVPEFLDEEQLRNLEVIPHFQHAGEIKSIVLQVVRRRVATPEVYPSKTPREPVGVQDSAGSIIIPDHQAVLSDLAETLDKELARIKKERLEPGDIKLFGRVRWVYYVRTVQVGNRRKAAWAASRLCWQFLRNRIIKGEHMVDHDRQSNGTFYNQDGQPRKVNQTYQILGKLEQQGNDHEALHLHWDGIFSTSTPYQERYYASFICDKYQLGGNRYIAGQWNGRSNSADYTPGGGYMIISPPVDKDQTFLGEAPTPGEAADLLKQLIKIAEELQVEIPALADPPRKWEWQERHAPSEDES